jgi:hypothetical protein
MKKIYILPLLMFFFFANCEKIVDIDVPSIPTKLIIDASFEVYFDESPVTANTVVRLSLSADYFDENIPVATNAIVFITYEINEIVFVINFVDTNSDGNYKPVNAFIPLENVAYELTIIYDNETYVGTAKRIKSTPLTNVVQGNETLFSGKETEIKVSFTDDVTEDNYYLFDFTNRLFLTLEDRFFNGTEYNFSSFYQEDEIDLPTTVTIKMSGVSKNYYTYFRVLASQSGQNGGGPFETVPSSLLGNMINTTNEDNFPLGYFHISETDTFTIDLVEKG